MAIINLLMGVAVRILISLDKDQQRTMVEGWNKLMCIKGCDGKKVAWMINVSKEMKNNKAN